MSTPSTASSTLSPPATPTYKQTVADCVYATYARLREKATITTHLNALTQRQAGDALAVTRSKRPTQQA